MSALGERDRERLRRRSLRLHGLPQGEIDGWIEMAEDVAAEVEGEFQARVEASYRELLLQLEDECGRVFLPTEMEARIRQEIEEIHARFDDPAPELDRLASHVIEIEEGESGWEDG